MNFQASEREDTERNSTAILSIRLQSSLAFQHNTYSTTVSICLKLEVIKQIICFRFHQQHQLVQLWSLWWPTRKMWVYNIRVHIKVQKPRRFKKPKVMPEIFRFSKKFSTTFLAVHLLKDLFYHNLVLHIISFFFESWQNCSMKIECSTVRCFVC